MPIKILFVCTGNTCRSSMAEALMRRLAESRLPTAFGPAGEERSPDSRAAAVQIEVRSAGTGARDGDPASGHAIEVMRERGIDLRSHRARRLTQDLVDWADVVLTMTASHKNHVLRMFAGAAGKTFTLGEFAAGPGGQSEEINDPWGKPQ